MSGDLRERYMLRWREGLNRLREWSFYLQETVWEPAVRAAIRGDFGPAREKWRKGELPPRKAQAALEKAWARLQTGRKGRLPKGQPPVFWGPLAQRELNRTDRLRAVRKYQELREQGLDREGALTGAVEWVNKNPLQAPAQLVSQRLRGKVTVEQLGEETRDGKTRRKLRIERRRRD